MQKHESNLSLIPAFKGTITFTMIPFDIFKLTVALPIQDTIPGYRTGGVTIIGPGKKK